MKHTLGGIAADGDNTVTDLALEGMHCASCVLRTEQALSGVAGVREASVNFATESARVTHDPTVPAAVLIKAVEQAGYHATEKTLDNPHEHHHADADRPKLLLAAALTAPAVAISMAWPMHPEVADWLLLALTAPVVFFCGSTFFVNAWKAARHGAATMDTLVAIGAGVAWTASLYEILTQSDRVYFENGTVAHSDHLYFESAAAIVTLILLGRWLESNTRHSMTAAIGKLLDLSPKMASLVQTGSQDRQVPTESLGIGDLIRIRPGEMVPVDGVIVEGESHFDEALLTGEPSPVHRTEGDAVSGGALNGSGSVVCRVTRAVTESRPAQIARLVADAQASKAPLQSLADRIASVFVPAVVAVAAVTFLVRLLAMHEPAMVAMLPAIAVLVVACPCAMGLAAPAAVVAGIGRGARLGVLIRDGATLQRAASVTTILLDKTGTLTEGKPSVVAVFPTPTFDTGYHWDSASSRAGQSAVPDSLRSLPFGGIFDKPAHSQGGSPEFQNLLSLAAAVEIHSEHPLAKAILNAAQQAGIQPPSSTDFKVHPGLGAEATVDGDKIAVGSPRFIGTLPPDLQALLEQSEGEGHTVVVLAKSGEPIGLVAIGDKIRPNAAAAVKAIQALNIETVMLTGDRRATAQAVAAAVGIQNVQAELLPENKAAAVRAARGEVAMVGDGINDAPALAAADVGIALGTGSDIAKETAGIVLLRNDLGAVPQAIRLARKTTAAIRANLAWAFVYNVAAIPIAAAGRLDPMIAAGAMAFSSLSVLLNSLRLTRFK